MECVAAVITIVFLVPLLAGRHVLWFCDNTRVLGSLVKGRSNDAVVHTLQLFLALFCFQLDITIWWEYVESDANWSDGVSRVGSKCPWAAAHNFSVESVAVPALSARSMESVIDDLRKLHGIGAFACSAFDDLLRAFGGAARVG